MSRHLLWDRSRAVADWKCPRSRYWNYDYNGTGVVQGSAALELYTGSCIHDGLAGIAHGLDIDAIATTAQKQMFQGITDNSTAVDEEDVFNFAMEQSSLVEGLLRGFYKHAWPILIAQYPNILAIERELTYKHDGFTFMSKPDLILGDDDGNAFYIEYKSTSSKKEEWINSWTTAVQLHSTCRAIKETLDIDISAVIVQGLYKGWQSYGKQSSPFCYSYQRSGNPPFTQHETRYDYAAGFKRKPVWEQAGGVKSWVDSMPETILADQFPQTPPIFINDSLVDAFFKQRASREAEIAAALTVIDASDDPTTAQSALDAHFPQRFDQCCPGWGKPCPYRVLCFGKITDPIDAGFIVRTPHHTPEAELTNS